MIFFLFAIPIEHGTYVNEIHTNSSFYPRIHHKQIQFHFQIETNQEEEGSLDLSTATIKSLKFVVRQLYETFIIEWL